jgi:hypothetical protein
MSDLSPFKKTGSTVSISATTTTGNAAISNIKGSVLAHNQGTTWAYLNFGVDNTVEAAATDYWLAPGSTQAFMVPTNMTYVAATMASGTGNIGITPGEGQ